MTGKYLARRDEKTQQGGSMSSGWDVDSIEWF